jgi:hypothetical protein
LSQIHNQGFPHELAKVHSHNRPTNPRNKSQTNPKQKRNSRSKGLRQSAVAWADCLHGGGWQSAGTRWTVRKHKRTVRKWHLNLQYRTVKKGPSVLYPRTVHAGWTVHTLLVDCTPYLVQPKTTNSTDRTTNAHKQVMNWMNTDPRGLSARCGQSSSSMSCSRSTPPSLCPIPRINQGIATKSEVKKKRL